MITIDEQTKFGKRLLQQLEAEQIVWLTTVSPKGVPQPSPVWFLWDVETFLIYSRADKPKIRNIKQNSAVTLHFNSDFGGHEIAIFTATAVVNTEPPAASKHAAYIEKYQKGIARINMTPESFTGAFSASITITPTKLRGY